MSFLKSPYVLAPLAFIAGAVVEKKFSLIARIPLVRDWLA